MEIDFRFRLHLMKLPDKLGIILSKHKTPIFVLTCFWHGFERFKYALIPKIRSAFRNEYFQKNRISGQVLYSQGTPEDESAEVRITLGCPILGTVGYLKYVPQLQRTSDLVTL